MLEVDIFMHDWDGQSQEQISAKAGAIELAHYFPVREQFWLNQLDGFLDKDVLFICGDFHVESFRKLLDAAGVPNVEVMRGLGVTDEDRYQAQIAINYLEAHPELG